MIDKCHMCMFITFVDNHILPASASANPKKKIMCKIYKRNLSNRVICKSLKKSTRLSRTFEFDTQQTDLECSSFKRFTLPPSMHQLNMEDIISKHPTPSQNSCQVWGQLYVLSSSYRSRHLFSWTDKMHTFKMSWNGKEQPGKRLIIPCRKDWYCDPEEGKGDPLAIS